MRRKACLLSLTALLGISLLCGCEGLKKVGKGALIVGGMAGAVNGDPDLLIKVAELDGETAESIRRDSQKSREALDRLQDTYEQRARLRAQRR